MKDKITGRSQENIENMVSSLIRDEDTKELQKLYYSLENFDALVLVRQDIFEYLRDRGVRVTG